MELQVDKTKNYKGFVSEIFPAFDEANQSFYCKVKFKTVPEIRIASTQLQANVITSYKKNIGYTCRLSDFAGKYEEVNNKMEMSILSFSENHPRWVTLR